MDKRISVIIPVYNAEKYLNECLDSVVNQTIGMDAIELILVDDASTDNSLQCLRNYKKNYPNDVVLVSLDKNQGQANARNIGISHVTAPYFTFLDADDWVETDIYEKLLWPAGKYQCDVIQCLTVTQLIGGNPYYESKPVMRGFYDIRNAIEKKRFFSQNLLEGVIGNSLFRTEWVKGNHFEFKKFSKYEDNYWMGIIKYSMDTYYLLPEYLFHYRILENSNCHSRNDNRHFERLKVELEKINYYQDTGLYDIYYEEIRKDFLKLFYENTLHIIFCQFDEIPLELIQSMQEIVKETFPDYLEYCKSSKSFVEPVLTVAFSFSLEGWESYKKAYIEWGAEQKEEGIVQFYAAMRDALGLKMEDCS